MTAINPSHAFVRNEIASAIRMASANTGVDADFLFRQAELESGFDPDARARTSSAEGLYQFIEQTWLQTVKRHGERHGLGWAAARISQTGNRFSVSEDAREVLALRNDPQAAATMAAAFASDNRNHLQNALGRPVNGTEMYLAHFLGPAGAARFLRAHDSAPDSPASHLLPDAARTNRPVFFTQSGRPRTVGEIYRNFAGKLDGARGDMPTQSAGQSPAVPAALSSEQNAALSATRDWLKQRGGTGYGDNVEVSPAAARLAYLTLTTAGI